MENTAGTKLCHEEIQQDSTLRDKIKRNLLSTEGQNPKYSFARRRSLNGTIRATYMRELTGLEDTATTCVVWFDVVDLVTWFMQHARGD